MDQMSSATGGGIEVMGGPGRYKDVIRHLRPHARQEDAAPSSHGIPLQTRNPASSVPPAAGGSDSLRHPATSATRGPEGGPGTARMKTRLLTLLLAAGALLAAVFTAFSIPAEAQTQTVHVRLPSGEVVP